MPVEPIENPYKVLRFQKSQKLRRVRLNEDDEKDRDQQDEPPVPEKTISDIDSTEKPQDQDQNLIDEVKKESDETNEPPRHIDIRI